MGGAAVTERVGSGAAEAWNGTSADPSRASRATIRMTLLQRGREEVFALTTEKTTVCKLSRLCVIDTIGPVEPRLKQSLLLVVPE
ncbi:hypothetical protein GCM10029976_033620 [Kribbella albertanoniae]